VANGKKRYPVTLSKSSLATYSECPRKWALHYQRWKLPPEIKRDVYFHYRLMPLNALVGQVVDDTITAMLRHYYNKQKWPVKIAEASEKLLRQYIDESVSWINQYEAGQMEPVQGRRQPIDKLFFDQPFSEQEIAEILLQVAQGVQSWINSSIPEFLLSQPLETWQLPPVGETPGFEIDGMFVYAKYDFALFGPEKTIIYDWKTGKVNAQTEEAVTDQLHTYALYAIQEWKCQPEQLSLKAVWLSLGGEMCEQDIAFDPARAEALKSEWRQRYAELVELLKGTWDNPNLLFQRFPLTDKLYRCERCSFRSCEGYARLSQPS
jgi:hypothetical protein